MANDIEYKPLLDSYLLIKPFKYQILRSLYFDFYNENTVLLKHIEDVSFEKAATNLLDILCNVIQASLNHYKRMQYFEHLAEKLVLINATENDVVKFSEGFIKAARKQLYKDWSFEFEKAWVAALNKIKDFITQIMKSVEDITMHSACRRQQI